MASSDALAVSRDEISVCLRSEVCFGRCQLLLKRTLALGQSGVLEPGSQRSHHRNNRDNQKNDDGNGHEPGAQRGAMMYCSWPRSANGRTECRV